MSESVRTRVTVTGTVQGVGFRYFVLERAQSLGVSGWVRNLRDGRVEAELEGEQESVNMLISAMREGPTFSHVESLHQFPLGGGTEYTDFRVRPDGQ
ncbi:MAG: acylphosphatase [Calditrichaeota bacterium]|nr:acylphosphatase [Calditrichota bacterium]MCB9366533.1 acylphosphatase [Calditrichota bacterium]MCB9391209.1 acylphosphatase [Calditrichota bacterium]